MIFNGFPSYGSPEEFADMALELFGGDAGQAARECAEAAFMNGRARDYLFWLEVGNLLGHEKTPREGGG